MGVEYYLMDDDRKVYYFLGKGCWQNDLIHHLSDLPALQIYIKDIVYRGRGGVGEERLAVHIFTMFNGVEVDRMYVIDDIAFGPPKSYKQIGDAYEQRYTGSDALAEGRELQNKLLSEIE